MEVLRVAGLLAVAMVLRAAAIVRWDRWAAPWDQADLRVSRELLAARRWDTDRRAECLVERRAAARWDMVLRAR